MIDGRARHVKCLHTPMLRVCVDPAAFAVTGDRLAEVRAASLTPVRGYTPVTKRILETVRPGLMQAFRTKMLVGQFSQRRVRVLPALRGGGADGVGCWKHMPCAGLTKQALT